MSRTVLFACIRITLRYETLLGKFTEATFRFLAREITLDVDPADRWVKRGLPEVLVQFPAFKTLRLTHIRTDYSKRLLLVFPSLTHLTLAFDRPGPSSGDFGLPAILRLAGSFQLLERLQITTEAEYNAIAPLAHLHTIHLNYPMLNARVLEFLTPPALESLHLTLRSTLCSMPARRRRWFGDTGAVLSCGSTARLSR